MRAVVGSEAQLYEQIARYMALAHQGVAFHFDLAGVNNPSKATRAMYGRLNSRGWPDLFIADIGSVMHDYIGLFLELKREGTRLKTKSGRWANEHVAEQAAVLEQLRKQGYAAEFAVGLRDTIEKIDNYLGVESGDATQF